jgi:hypothetical protein
MIVHTYDHSDIAMIWKKSHMATPKLQQYLACFSSQLKFDFMEKVRSDFCCGGKIGVTHVTATLAQAKKYMISRPVNPKFWLGVFSPHFGAFSGVRVFS